MKLGKEHSSARAGSSVLRRGGAACELNHKISKERPTVLYAKYSHATYKLIPEHTITVSGRDITFLVDSGATESSVIKCEECDITPKMDVRYLRMIGATSTTVIERCTLPLSCLVMMRLKGILNSNFCCHNTAR